MKKGYLKQKKKNKKERNKTPVTQTSSNTRKKSFKLIFFTGVIGEMLKLFNKTLIN